MNNQEIISKYNANKSTKLIVSLAIDAVGMASFIIPALGEFGDLLIAPLTAVAIYMTHRTKVGAFAGFIEELLPFTDIIPTATLIWYKRYHMDKDQTFRQFIIDQNYDSLYMDKALRDNNLKQIESIEFDEKGDPIKYK